MKAILWTVALILFVPAPAYAQEVGVRGGVTAGPAFAFGGVRVAFAPRALFVRLEADLAGGPQAATMVTWAIESPKIHRSTLAWAPYFGGGLTFFLAHKRSISGSGERLGGAWCLLFGVENRRRVSLEIQINLERSDIPRLYFTLGYRFH